MKAWIALAATAALAACGGNKADGDSTSAGDGPAPPATAAAATDPCSLVTPEEVGSVIGEKITGTEKSDGSCTYQTADAQASSVTIELNQTNAKGEMEAQKSAAGVLKDMGSAAAGQGGAGADVNAMLSESGDMPKIGDEAFFASNQQLSVLKGSSYVAVTPPMMRSRMSGGNPLLSAGDKKKMAIAIAEKAVARLP